jgi:lactoylglutathione lyase
MPQFISALALLVPDYDEAKAYYRDVLGFAVTEDKDLGGGKRWVTVAPPGSRETRLLLAQAASPAQTARIGDQTGGRVFLILYTDDFWRDFKDYGTRGVHFCETPRVEPYGTVAVFEDRYGNRWDLLQPST